MLSVYMIVISVIVDGYLWIYNSLNNETLAARYMEQKWRSLNSLNTVNG